MPSAKAEIDIPPPLTIRQAHSLKELILNALKGCSTLTLRLPESGAVDLSFVQLIESARIYASRNAVGLTLARPAEGELLELINSAGLIPTAQTFWLCQGESQ